MSDRYRKNIDKVSSMVDGNYQNKIQTGYTPTEETHKVGDIWTDSDDVQWEQKKGYRVKLTKLANAEIAEQCSDCKKYISKKWDKDVYFWNSRCYYCQIDYESQFSRNTNFSENVTTKSEYDKYLKERGKKVTEDWIKKFEEENKELIKEIENLENPFSKKIANALANGEVEMTINKNIK